ncbi:MAG: hypothetical protein AB8C02_16815 [Halioglobus sp.]
MHQYQHLKTSVAKLENALLILLVFLGAAGNKASAQQERPIETVKVTASSADVSAGGDIDADAYYDETDIEAFGASTLEELLEELAPDVASVRGRFSGKPIVLVNGRRIASFTGIRRYPPEAVKRLEIFPEEVALRYGYRADQKVVNIQLQPHFRAKTLRGSTQVSEGNEGAATKVSADYVRFQLDKRLSFDLQAENQNEILESDRSVPARLQGRPFSIEGNLRSPGGGEIDAALSELAGETVTAATLPSALNHAPLTLASLLPSANNPIRSNIQGARSLQPKREILSSGINYSFPIGEELLATVSGSYEQTEQTSYLGLPRYTQLIAGEKPSSPFQNTVELNRYNPFNGPLKREQIGDVYTLSGDVAATYSGWTWSWITNLTVTERTTRTDRSTTVGELPEGTNPFGNLTQFLQLQRDRQDSDIRNYETRILIDGTLGQLPHGQIATSLSGALTRNEQRNKTSSVFSNTTGDSATAVSRRLERNVSQMRASINAPLLDGQNTGKLSANMNGELSRYSDFGQITTFGFGLNWKLNNALAFILSYTKEAGAPEVAELSDPLLLTPNQSVYDFASDSSVRATRIGGGNPALKPDKREIWRVGVRLRPIKKHDLSFNVDWVESKTDAPIDSFPAPSEEIEAVFPERFIRDNSGNLLTFDTRPINLHLESTQEMRTGFRYKRAIKSSKASRAEKKSTSARIASKRRNAGKGRLAFALDHTWTIENELTIAPGLAAIDYVGRSTNGRGRGGAEHEITARLSYYRNRMGIRINANWQSAISTLPNAAGTSALRQADLYTVDVSAFKKFRPKSGLKGMRVRLKIENLFNEKADIRDRSGVVPAGRSGDELDPFGRTVKLELRKMFR